MYFSYLFLPHLMYLSYLIPPHLMYTYLIVFLLTLYTSLILLLLALKVYQHSEHNSHSRRIHLQSWSSQNNYFIPQCSVSSNYSYTPRRELSPKKRRKILDGKCILYWSTLLFPSYNKGIAWNTNNSWNSEGGQEFSRHSPDIRIYHFHLTLLKYPVLVVY